MLKRTETSIKQIFEKQPKKIFLLSALGEKCGRVKMENSVRALTPALAQNLTELQVQYLSHDQVNRAS